MRSVNPATGEVVEEHEEHDLGDAKRMLREAEEVFQSWGSLDVEERTPVLERAGEILRERKEDYADLMTREMGKKSTGARGEVEKCAWLCDHYAERAADYLQDERFGSPPGVEAYVRYEPTGPILAVMPWNYPFWQVFRFAVPNLAAGNVGLLKHASNVQGCAKAIEEIFHDVGAPEAAFRALIAGHEVTDELIQDPGIRGVTLTGSSRAGRKVAEIAGANLKKTVLELGGSDPFVVLDDAPLEKAIDVGASARLQNTGQSCIAAKRFIVHTEVYDEFLDRFVEAMEGLTVGDPTDPETDLGPIARPDLMEDLHRQVQESVEMGANLVTGGEPLDREGAFYRPTVLTDLPDRCPATNEETFGPVAAVIEVEDEEEAMEEANDTNYGLGASVWTEDLERGERLSRRVDSGMVFVNQLTKSDPRLPFGGVKDSGYGRELSRHGIQEFCNAKTVWIES